MNAVRRRMPPGVNRLFYIAVPDLDFPLGIARYDLAIACEQPSPDGAAVWKGTNQLMELRLPEPGTFVCARREDVVAIGTENGRVGLGVVAEGGSPNRAGSPVPELHHTVKRSSQNPFAVRAERAGDNTLFARIDSREDV